MKILYPMILFLAVMPCLITLHAYGIPPIAPQVEYFNSDTVLIGKVLTAEPYSPTQMKYHIQVEQYLKNPQTQDIITVIADGTNKTLVERGLAPDTVYDVGQNALLYLKNENGNYVAWYFSHSTDSLCDPAPTKDDLNFSLSQDTRFSALPAYSPLRVETGIPNLFRVDDTILMHYDTWNRHFTTKTFDVEFDVKNETNGELLSNVTKQVELKPCIGHQTVDTSFIPKKAGTYEIDVIFDNSLLGTTVEVEHNVSGVKLEAVPLSPMQQFKEGIKPEYVTCWKGLQLIFKAEDQTPICVKPDNVKKLVSRGWAILHYHDPAAKPKITLYDYSYDGIDKDNGTVSINDQTYYQTTLSYSAYNLPKRTSVSFQNVTFAFPQGSLSTPGGGFLMLDMTFPDGSEEIYGGKALVQNGSATEISGIQIPTQYGPHLAVNSVTVLSSHTIPQAGITICHDNIKLLVSK
ncbi:MAG: hypothetical protein LV477_00655 [Candidatus Nitrosotalea sp.]|nr:hypothetical protein [Candidatus Nitrosotalea sp.]